MSLKVQPWTISVSREGNEVKFHFFDMAAPLTRGKRLLRLSLGLPLETDEGMN